MATPLQSSSQVQGHHSNGLFGSYRENVQIPWRARVFGKIVQYAPLKNISGGYRAGQPGGLWNG